MARLTLLPAFAAAVLLGVQPVAAQISSIFDTLFRPPADVPTPPSSIPAGPPPRGAGDRDSGPGRPSGGYAPREGVVPAPSSYPSDRTPLPVEAQPLSPLPGTEPTDTQPTLGLPQLPPGPQQAVGTPPSPGQVQQPTGQIPLPSTSGRPSPPGSPPQLPNAAKRPTDEAVIEPPAQKVVNPTAIFSGLDKITGRTITFDVAINETVQFGALQVTPRACYTRPPTETPNTDGFVEVDEITLKGEVRRIFSGWMFAASPSLHAVEHPIYDVWLVDCKNGAETAANATPAAPAAQAAQANTAASSPSASSAADPATGSPAGARANVRLRH